MQASFTIPGLSFTVTGLSATIYSLSVSFQGLSVIKIQDSGTQTLKVPDWPGKLIGLLGSFTDRPAEVTDCVVIYPGQSVFHHVQSGSPYLGQADYKPTRWELFDISPTLANKP